MPTITQFITGKAKTKPGFQSMFFKDCLVWQRGKNQALELDKPEFQSQLQLSLAQRSQALYLTFLKFGYCIYKKRIIIHIKCTNSLQFSNENYMSKGNYGQSGMGNNIFVNQWPKYI